MYKREIDIKRTQDIEITRTADEVRGNFPLVGGCCPTFQYGFEGAGSLELGLSALNAFVPACSDGEDALNMGDAAKIRFVSQFAWDFRRQFANEVLGVLPQEKGVYVIKATAVREWIEARRSEQIKQSAAEESSGRERFREVIEKYPNASEETTGGGLHGDLYPVRGRLASVDHRSWRYGGAGSRCQMGAGRTLQRGRAGGYQPHRCEG